ncbi:TetR/AcrR family transcriptional regulator [Streptomyces sp. NPDC056909]|uniref:TetR/AcrR family transcriptional regulator n=1 Tax=Streptomyces sp. NPDC056909 TaxID=3345963 RepID=UPI0036CB26EF
MPTPPAQPPSRRSRLSPERERELLEVTLELLAELGYDRMTMADVAKRTKCSTATLYRQWENKQRLVITALKAAPRRTFVEIDTGSLRGDLRELSRGVFRHDPVMRSFIGIWNAVMRDDLLMRALREIIIEPEMRALRHVLQRSVERGEISPDNPALGLVGQTLFGPLIIQNLFTGERPTPELSEDIINAVLLPALTAGRPAGDAT